MPQQNDGETGGKIKISRRTFVAGAAIFGTDMAMFGNSVLKRVRRRPRT